MLTPKVVLTPKVAELTRGSAHATPIARKRG
jgi:hypothetical protein